MEAKQYPVFLVSRIILRDVDSLAASINYTLC